jgi:hypothetical protein
MVEIKDAVKAAKDFAGTVFPEADLPGLRLEEVEFEEARGEWIITLSWADPTPGNRAIIAALGSTRIYKLFIVDAGSGRVRAMKIRETAGGN